MNRESALIHIQSHLDEIETRVRSLRRAIRELANGTPAPVSNGRPTIAAVLEFLAREWGQSEIPLILSRERIDGAARKRQIAMWLMRRLVGCSLTQIGSRFMRDHSTVMYSLRVIDGGRKRDPVFAAHLDRLKERCKATF